jgi:hypothetical protein
MGSFDPPYDAVLLREIAELEECEVITVTDVDHVSQQVPPWAEIILKLNRAGGQTRKIMLRRTDGELIIECLREVLHPDSQGVLSGLWDELDAQFGKLKEIPKSHEDYPAQSGHCLGLAKAIARVVNPYDPDLDAVRAKALERWYEASA